MKEDTIAPSINDLPAACFNAEQNSISYLFYTSIGPIATKWDSLANSIFLESRYLEILEKYPPLDYEFIYCLIKQQGKIVGIVYNQIRPLKLDENFQSHDHGFNLFERVRKLFLGFIRHKLLINGNVLLTGPYGSAFSDEIDNRKKVDLLKISNKLLLERYNENSKLKIKSILLKDYFDDGYLEMGTDYTEFKVQPSMHLYIPKEWHSIDDYLVAIKSKYKVRYKRALKKCAPVIFRKMSHAEVVENNDKMFDLFSQTAQKADFNLFQLHPRYFEKLHEYLEDDMHTFGVFENDELIAFYTLIKNNNVAEAHFLGYDMEKNKDYQLYQNMLYKMLEVSISLKVSELNLSRTALEIKSSIGAVPKDLSLMAKYQGKLINKTLPFFLKLIVPEKDWEPRSPFKDN